MKAKTIKSVLRKKFTDWTANISSDDVRKAVTENTIITGGCIPSMLLGEEINDFDVYFRDHDTALLVAQHYIKEFLQTSQAKFGDGKRVGVSVKDEDGHVQIVVQSAGVAREGVAGNYRYFEQGDPEGEQAAEYIEDVASELKDEGSKSKKKYRPIFLTANAITLSDKIQIAVRFYGEADEIHKTYDFVHCTNYWDSGSGELVLKQPALESLLARELRYLGSLYPVCSVIRTRKFLKRGWHINAGQYLKMAMQISDLDLTDIDVLEDQLTGVDTAYFFELIAALKKDMKKRSSKEVDATYLMTVIDKIF